MKIKMFFLILISFISLIALSGCSSNLNSNFDCPMKPGVMCQSLDGVNTQVDQGKLGSNNSGQLNIGQTAFDGNFAPTYPAAVMQPGQPLRYGETVMRIWVAPYQDKDGNYYQPSTFYTIVKPGHWIGNPVTAVNADGDPA